MGFDWCVRLETLMLTAVSKPFKINNNKKLATLKEWIISDWMAGIAR